MNEKSKAVFLIILNKRENIQAKSSLKQIFLALEDKCSSLQLQNNDFWKLIEIYAHERAMGDDIDITKLFPDTKICVDRRLINFLIQWKENNMEDNDYEY